MLDAERPAIAEVQAVHPRFWWLMSDLIPWMFGLGLAGFLAAAIPLAVSKSDLRFFLLLALATPAYGLLRPAWSGWRGFQRAASVTVEPERLVIAVPGALPKALVVPRDLVHSVWKTTSGDVRGSLVAADLSGFSAAGRGRPTKPVIVVIMNTLVDTGKIPAYGIGWLMNRVVPYTGPHRDQLLRGFIVEPADPDQAWDRFDGWPRTTGTLPDDIRDYLDPPAPRLADLPGFRRVGPDSLVIPLDHLHSVDD